MQQLGRQAPVTARSAAIQRYLSEGKAFEQSAGPTVQLLARDAFVSETAVKLDQLVIEMKGLARELALLKGDVAELREDTKRNGRFSEFLDREHKWRAQKLEELCKKFEYLKSRFDTIDGNSKGDYHAFRNFESVSRRLTELGELERAFRDVDWKLKLSAGLFIGSVLVWVVMLAFA